MGKMSFEETFSRLQEIVKQLENGDLPLQKSLDIFEEGIGLFKQCQTELQQAEGKIAKLVKTLEDQWEVVPFDV
ncbi:MAG: exodeoxyribonuclease VII small subunit [Candidatus Saccharibacteria bacterium]